MALLVTNTVGAAKTSLTGWKPVRFYVRFTLGHKIVNGVCVYGHPQRYTLREVCIKLADAWSLTERELAYIVSMRPGTPPFANGEVHIERRP